MGVRSYTFRYTGTLPLSTTLEFFRHSIFTSSLSFFLFKVSTLTTKDSTPFLNILWPPERKRERGERISPAAESITGRKEVLEVEEDWFYIWTVWVDDDLFTPFHFNVITQNAKDSSFEISNANYVYTFRLRSWRKEK